MGAVLWHAAETSSVMALQIRIEVLKPVLSTLRFALIGLVALSWPTVTRSLHRWGRLDEAGRANLLSLRWRIVTWLVVIELMLGQNLFGWFLAALQSAGA